MSTLIGAGEGLITALVVAAVWRARPELVDEIATFEARPVLGFGLLTASGLAMFVAPFACGWPDGLEKVASALGFDRPDTRWYLRLLVLVAPLGLLAVEAGWIVTGSAASRGSSTA